MGCRAWAVQATLNSASWWSSADTERAALRAALSNHSVLAGALRWDEEEGGDGFDKDDGDLNDADEAADSGGGGGGGGDDAGDDDDDDDDDDETGAGAVSCRRSCCVSFCSS